MKNRPHNDESLAALRNEVTNHLYAHNFGTLVTGGILAGIIAYILWGTQSAAVMLGWLGVTELIYLGRMMLVRSFKRASTDHTGNWLNRFRAGTILSGMAWGGASLLLFPSNDPVNQSVLFFAVIGIGAGGAISYAIDAVSLIGYQAALLIPLVIRLFVENTPQAMAIALMVILFLGYIIMAFRNSQRDMREFIRLRLEAVNNANKIHEQNSFLNAIFQNEPECVMVVSPDGMLMQMNQAGLAMLEVESLEEARKSGFGKFVTPEYRQAFAALHTRVCAGDNGQLEFQIRGKKGTLRWLDTQATPIRDSSNRITALLGVTRDVTNRKHMEELEKYRAPVLELLASGAPLNDILESIVRGMERIDSTMLCSILLLDPEGQHLLHGTAPSLPDFYNDAIHGVRIGPGVGSCGTAAYSGQRVVVEDIQTHPYWAPYKELANKAGLGSCWSEPIMSSSGKVLGTFAIYHRQACTPEEKDIALIAQASRLATIAIERSQAAEALQMQRESFRQMLETSPIGVRIKRESDQRLTFLNQSYADLFHTTKEDVLGSDPIRFYRNPDDYLEISKQLSAGKIILNRQIELVTVDGEPLWVMASYFPFAYEGQPAVLAWFYDVTVLHRARESAESLARSKSDFLANMSHEIRTPMNAIIGLSHLALNKDISAEVRDYLEKINTSSESLLGILNDILDFSKMEAGKLAIEYKPFSLNIVLDNLYNLFSFRAIEKHLNLGIEVAKDTPTDLVGDSLRIQQVLSNVLGNAIKFTEHGHVFLHVKRDHSETSRARLIFSIEDSGIGMTSEEQKKLFTPFSQADSSTTRRFGGTGLGLAISRNLLQLMGSDFHVVSIPGKGTTFSFDLLLDIASPNQRVEPIRRSGERKVGTHFGELRERGEVLRGCRILVAEDNHINQQVVKEFLQLSGITVDIANNGIEALQLLEQHTYDAVLMDAHMPEMGGVEATRHIRSKPELSALPVIALTAGVTQDERDNCKASGMNDFIAKPIIPEELIGVLIYWVIRKKHLVDVPLPIPPTTHQPNRQLDDLTGFDFTNLKKMTGGDEALILQLLRTLHEDSENTLSEVENKISLNDLDAARKLVHAIKGAAGNLGATALHAAAATLEASLKQGVLDEEAYSGFQKTLLESRAVLAQLLQNA